MTSELWNSDDCATYLRCSRRHFMMRIKTASGFPPAIHLPMLGGKTRPLWRADDVRAYVDGFARPRQNHASSLPAP